MENRKQAKIENRRKSKATEYRKVGKKFKTTKESKLKLGKKLKTTEKSKTGKKNEWTKNHKRAQKLKMDEQ